mmetsp:Transcript_29081/g.45579  ORF Transcript_29081/g.45579 Transcript_29081/m.45579 type:complete len:193 (-) Transcript_29081:92-670(-)
MAKNEPRGRGADGLFSLISISHMHNPQRREISSSRPAPQPKRFLRQPQVAAPQNAPRKQNSARKMEPKPKPENPQRRIEMFLEEFAFAGTGEGKLIDSRQSRWLGIPEHTSYFDKTSPEVARGLASKEDLWASSPFDLPRHYHIYPGYQPDESACEAPHRKFGAPLHVYLQARNEMQARTKRVRTACGQMRS